MKLKLISNEFNKEVDVIGLVALVKNNVQAKAEKDLGLSLYLPKEDIIEEGLIYIKTNNDGITKGFSPKVLKTLLSNFINNGLLHKFDFNSSGEINISTINILSKDIYRYSRRYLILKVDNEICITNCSRIGELTRHYKENYEKNKTGLQWQNLCKNFNYDNYKHTSNSKEVNIY